MEEQDYQRVVGPETDTRFLPGTSIEIVRHVERPGRIEHAVFDFDGTLSLIREGWPDVMVPMMVDVLVEAGAPEPRESLQALARNFVAELTGKQTIYQMIRLADEVRIRGGIPRDPGEYKQIYHDRLMQRIQSRRDDLQRHRRAPADLLVPGSLDLLRALAERDVQLYLASGTDERYVREEVELLSLTPFFAERVYGALEDYKSFSKEQVIRRILSTHQVDGSRLVGFGDGYVEIANIKDVGGTAVAVASDEAGRSGQPDRWKRDRLIGAGADVVIPDFQEWQPLIEYLFEGARYGRSAGAAHGRRAP